MPAEKNIDICGLGEAMVEFNAADPGHAARYLQGFGGDTSNAVIAAARAGARCAYLTRVGDDAFGAKLSALWNAERIDTRGVQVAPGEDTGLYFISHGPRGHVFSYRRNDSAASRMDPEWLRDSARLQVLAASRWLHTSGITMAISSAACDTVFEAFAIARSHGTQIALDPNLRLKLWPLARARACLRAAVTECDVFLPSLEDAELLCGPLEPQAMVDWAHAAGASCVVLKMGAAGALVSDTRRTVHIPGRSVSLVDATGAGDCFSGYLLARLCQGQDLFEAAREANVAASLAVQGFGAVMPLPTRGDVAAAQAQDAAGRG